MSNNVTLWDVAAEAAVSGKTVSRVLNNEPHVAPEKVERVRRAIAKLHYRPNVTARELRSAVSSNIAFFYLNPERIITREYYYSEIFDHAHKELLGREFYTLLVSPDKTPDDYTGYLIEAFHRRRASGILLADLIGCDYKAIIQANIPCVTFNRSVKGKLLASVSPANFQGAREATEYLLRLGHRRIAFVGMLAGRPCSEARYQGYLAALKGTGVRPVPEYTFEVPGNRREYGASIARTVLSMGTRAPTALFVYTDYMAIALMNALQEAGKKTPEDISIVGFDDVEPATMVRPQLTTVHAPRDVIGQKAAGKLLAMISGQEEGSVEECPTKLVIRKSAAAPRSTRRKP